MSPSPAVVAAIGSRARPAGGTPATIQWVGISEASYNAPVNEPSGCAEVDFILLNIGSFTASDSAPVSMPGWTFLTRQVVTGVDITVSNIYYRFRGATALTGINPTMSSGDFRVMHMCALRNVHPTDPVPAFLGVTAAAFAALSVTYPASRLVACTTSWNESPTALGGTPTMTRRSSGSPYEIATFDGLMASAGNAGAYSWSGHGASSHVGVLMALRPAEI